MQILMLKKSSIKSTQNQSLMKIKIGAINEMISVDGGEGNNNIDSDSQGNKSACQGVDFDVIQNDGKSY